MELSIAPKAPKWRRIELGKVVALETRWWCDRRPEAIGLPGPDSAHHLHQVAI